MRGTNVRSVSPDDIFAIRGPKAEAKKKEKKKNVGLDNYDASRVSADRRVSTRHTPVEAGARSSPTAPRPGRSFDQGLCSDSRSQLSRCRYCKWRKSMASGSQRNLFCAWLDIVGDDIVPFLEELLPSCVVGVAVLGIRLETS